MDLKLGEIEAAARRLPAVERQQLIESIAQSLREESVALSAVERRTSLAHLLDEMTELPVVLPNDGFSNRYHDSAIYGESQ